jgi:GNAT superfamily N-acetyltransferase
MGLQFREVLATDRSLARGLIDLVASGRVTLWVCEIRAHQVGHCVGLRETGEIIGPSVDESYRRQGIGTRLLGLVVDSLRTCGCRRIWVDAPAIPSTPGYCFYRVLGWQSTGGRTQPDPFPGEILELPAGAV